MACRPALPSAPQLKAQMSKTTLYIMAKEMLAMLFILIFGVRAHVGLCVYRTAIHIHRKLE